MSLYESAFCRLCSERNDSGVDLYDQRPDLLALVNAYLPLKIQDDGKLPRTICPGCHIQVQATVSFFDLIVEGQKKLKEIRQNEILEEQKLELLSSNMGLPELSKSSIRSMDQSDVSLDDLTHVLELGESLYSNDHMIALKMEGLDKPKRKRGRPRKFSKLPGDAGDPHAPPPTPPPLEQPPEPEPEPVQEFTADGKARRRRKVPIRYQEGVQSQELERIFREEGVDDDFEYKDTDTQVNEILNGDNSLDEQEIIGRMESKDGQELGEVILNNVAGPTSYQKKKIQFQCEICNRSFTQQTKFLEHKATHASIHYQCGGCTDKYALKDDLELHQRLTDHTGEAVIFIDIEKSAEKSLDSVKIKEAEEEVAQEVQKRKKLSCPICRKPFRYNNSLKGHMLSSHKNQRTPAAVSGGYPCDVCGKRLKHPSSVVYHKQTEHNNGRRFVCNKCGKSFKHRQLLRRHQVVHSEKRPYYCKQCTASFKTKANLLNHQSTHTGIKKYFCELCGNHFAHKTSLTLHYRWHTGHKPYQCDVCKKCFSQKGNLQEHMRIHTGEKPFACSVCSRRFTTSSQCKLHIKRHTGERPFKCDYCEKTFLHRDTWKCHVRRHRGEKPYRCNYCSRDFPEMWALKKHLRLHTGERPYTCQTCGKAFADCSNLKKHKKVHCKETPPKLKKEDSEIGVDFWNMIRTQVDQSGAETDRGEAAPATAVVAATSVEGSNVQTATAVAGNAEMQQLIYVTYQDQAEPNSKIAEKYFVVPSCDVGLDNKDEDDVTEPYIAMQVTDEQGNPIHFTLHDGTQLQVTTSDGKSLQVTTSDGQVIPVTEGQQTLPAELTPVHSLPHIPVTHLMTDEGGNLTQIEVPENDIEFVTDENQEVRMLTSLNSTSIHIPSPFLSIG